MTETTTKPGVETIAFHELANRARIWDEQLREMPSLPAAAIGIGGNEFNFGEISIPLDQESRNRLFVIAGAPQSYLSQRSIDIQNLALREHLQQGTFGEIVTPVLQAGKLLTLHSGRLAEMTYSEVLGAVSETLGDDAAPLSVTKIDHSDTRLELEVTSPAKSMEVRRGDIIRGGLHISHSRYQGDATQIFAFIYRLVCENGMIQRQCVSQGIVRTRKPPAGHPNAKEMLMDQVRRLTQQTWNRVEKQMSEFQAASHRQVEVVPLVRQFLQRARISTKVTDSAEPANTTIMDRILAAWRLEGADDSYFGAVNALTRVGTHDLSLSPRQRRLLILLGGLMAFSGAHICPRCFSVISDSGTRHDNEDDRLSGHLLTEHVHTA